MATIAIGHARHLGHRDGLGIPLKGGPEHPELKETASQTYVEGSPIYRDSNGTYAVVADATGISAIAGLAAKKATGVTGTPVRYKPLRPGDRLVMNLSTSTTSLAILDDVRNLNVTSGKLVCGAGTTADGTVLMVRIVDLYAVSHGYEDGDAVGDTTGRVVVEVLAAPGLQG